MIKKPDSHSENELIELALPKLLIERVKAYCGEKNITPYDFIIDAINEKLQLAHKERRRKPRL